MLADLGIAVLPSQALATLTPTTWHPSPSAGPACGSPPSPTLLISVIDFTANYGEKCIKK